MCSKRGGRLLQREAIFMVDSGLSILPKCSHSCKDLVVTLKGAGSPLEKTVVKLFQDEEGIPFFRLMLQPMGQKRVC